jgi:predicted MFS family arabinose efflux permease
VLLLAAAVFLVRAAALMLGPLLVALAAAFHTSVAAAGQLAAAINVSWAMTALFAGPMSDTYGRRRVGLTGLLVMAAGILGSVLAWSYWALLACRLLTGVGAAMIPPNSMAVIADHFPAAQWVYWSPPTHPAGRAVAFRGRLAAVSRSAGMWHVLGANALYQTAAFGLFTYLAAFLVHAYGGRTGNTALPLALALAGAMLGSFLGGAVAGRTWRIGIVALALVIGGLLVGVAFVAAVSLWVTVLLAGAGAMLLTVFEPVTWTLTAELAGDSRATANGMLAASNQIGATTGASMGGVVLALGGFSLVGLFCMGAALIAALVIGMKVRGGALRAQVASA